MTDLPEKILYEIEKKGEVSSLDLAGLFSTDHQKIVGAIKSLQCQENMINAEMESIKRLELTKEGEMVAEKGMVPM